MVVLLPIMFLSRAYVTRTARNQIQFHEQERVGINYIRPVTALLVQITEHRLNHHGDVAGAVAALDAADQLYGSALSTSQRWGAWKDLFATAGKGHEPTFDQYTQLSDGFVDLVTHVANTSNLILDPALDSYYLMDIAVIREPMLLGQLGQLGQLGRPARSPPTAK